MDTFTFDDIYFFDRQPYDSCWYAYTHPAKKPFRHGRFNVDSCRFSSHCENLGQFTTKQIAEIEGLLTRHRSAMDLTQFDLHLQLPSHYQSVPSDSEVWNRVQRCRRRSWPNDPALGVAFDDLILQNPAYRLTRPFVSSVIRHSKRVTTEEATEYLSEVAEDQWTYDYAPYAKDGETYESYFADLQAALSKPATGHEYVEPKSVHSISALTDVFFVVTGRDSATHFYDTGDLLVPLPIPVRSSSHFEFYIL